MSKLTEARLRVVLYEGSGSETIPVGDRFALMSELLDSGYNVTLVNGKGEVGGSDGAALVVLGRFEGDTPSFAQADGADDGGAGVTFTDIRGKDTAAVLAAVQQVGEVKETVRPGDWKPWFPVIDFDRCTNCMQCLSFCLFDVYAVDKTETITVQNQDKCKTDCPACSRVCPEVAILFPKYTKGPINGDIVRDADIQREAMKVDVSTLLGGNIYAALRDRQRDARKRFSTERDESRALIERRRCLKKLQGDLDIPDEVLMSLPSVGDIEERAARAREKAEKRRARSQTVKDVRPAPSQEDWGI